MTNRRDFLKLAALFSVSGSLSLLQACSERLNQNPNAPLTIGYLPITDAAPLLIAHEQGLFHKRGLDVVKPVLFRSWAQLVEAFISGQVNVVHVLSPMTIWARYGSQAPVKVVMWNHTAGSALTVRLDIDKIDDLNQQTIAIPFWYSIHNVVLQHILRAHGLKVTEKKPQSGEVKLSVMSPADMIAALAAKTIAGFIVAEPFNAAAETQGIGKVLRFSADVWKDHACCVILMHENDLNHRPQWTQSVVDALVEAQIWGNQNRAKTAALLAKNAPNQYTPHEEKILAKVLTPHDEDWQKYSENGIIRHPEWQQNRIDFQPYPYPSYSEELLKMLQKTHIAGQNRFLHKLDPTYVAHDLVDERFIRQSLHNQNGWHYFGLPENLSRHEIIEV